MYLSVPGSACRLPVLIVCFGKGKQVWSTCTLTGSPWGSNSLCKLGDCFGSAFTSAGELPFGWGLSESGQSTESGIARATRSHARVVSLCQNEFKQALGEQKPTRAPRVEDGQISVSFRGYSITKPMRTEHCIVSVFAAIE